MVLSIFCSFLFSFLFLFLTIIGANTEEINGEKYYYIPGIYCISKLEENLLPEENETCGNSKINLKKYVGYKKRIILFPQLVKTTNEKDTLDFNEITCMLGILFLFSAIILIVYLNI
jgi:hypothetical protein